MDNSIFQGRAEPLSNTDSANYIDTKPLPASYPVSGLGQWNSVMNGIRSAMSGVSGGLISGVVGLGGQLLQNAYNARQADKERAWNERMMNEQNEWSLNMWNRTNEYNSPLAQRQRMEDAGLNPLYYGLDGSSANGLESAQPLGYQRANMDNFSNPVAEGLSSAMQLAQIEQTKAQTTKIKSDTEKTSLESDFLRQTLDARVEGEKLANALTKEQIEQVKTAKKQMEATISKLIEETKSEKERQNLLAWQVAVQKATEKQITELLPLQKLLVSAQAENERAQASLAYTQKAYQLGLLQSGYISTMVLQMEESIKKTVAEREFIEMQSSLKELEKKVRSGEPFEISKWCNEHNWAKVAHPVLNFLSTDLWSILNAIGTSSGPLFAGLFAGAGTAGMKSLNQSPRPKVGY